MAQGVMGVNYSTLKKFANFLFDNSVETTKKYDGNVFVIFISKEVYDKKKPLVEKFEDEFKVTVKSLI